MLTDKNVVAPSQTHNHALISAQLAALTAERSLLAERWRSLAEDKRLLAARTQQLNQGNSHPRLSLLGTLDVAMFDTCDGIFFW